jgi:hypothetical protein
VISNSSVKVEANEMKESDYDDLGDDLISNTGSTSKKTETKSTKGNQKNNNDEKRQSLDGDKTFKKGI